MALIITSSKCKQKVRCWNHKVNFFENNFKTTIIEWAKIHTEFARDKFARENLSVTSPIKFRMRNFTSPNVEQLDMSWAARVLNESRMNKNMLPIDYE